MTLKHYGTLAIEELYDDIIFVHDLALHYPLWGAIGERIKVVNSD